MRTAISPLFATNILMSMPRLRQENKPPSFAVSTLQRPLIRVVIAGACCYRKFCLKQAENPATTDFTNCTNSGFDDKPELETKN
jgi:hypothetical protein